MHLNKFERHFQYNDLKTSTKDGVVVTECGQFVLIPVSQEQKVLELKFVMLHQTANL